MSSHKTVQELMLAGDDPDDSSPASMANAFDDDFDICPKCSVENDEGATKCWSCGGSMKRPTLADQGKKLPVGLVAGTKESGYQLNKRFELIPLTWPIERAIGRYWQKRREQLSIGEYVGVVLAFTASQIGDADMTKLKVPERLLFLNQMFIGDVFYMYAYLRLISMGNELNIKGLQCIDPECKHRFNYPADISSLEIIGFDKYSDIEHEIVLPDGFEFAGKIRNTLIVRPPLWLVMGNPQFIQSEQDVFETSFLSSVVEIDDLPRGAILTAKDLDQFSKSDIEYARDASESILAGPRWTIEGECPKCQERFFFELDWTFENFFGRSFVSRRRRKRSKR